MKAYRIDRPATAFSLSTGKKRPRKESADHLKWIRTLPCVVCGTRVHVDGAHLRMGSPLFGKTITGMGEKPSDMWTLPLCRRHHELQHSMGEDRFWLEQKVNPFILALSLWRATGDTEAAEIIISEQGGKNANAS